MIFLKFNFLTTLFFQSYVCYKKYHGFACRNYNRQGAYGWVKNAPLVFFSRFFKGLHDIVMSYIKKCFDSCKWR